MVTLKSYHEWNNEGYRIHRGEKAAYVKDGEGFFEPRQVYDCNELTTEHEDYLIRSQEWEDMPH